MNKKKRSKDIEDGGYVKIRPGDGRVYALSEEFLNEMTNQDAIDALDESDHRMIGGFYMWDPFKSNNLSSEWWKREKKKQERRERIRKGADIILNRLTIDYEIYKQNLKIEQIQENSFMGFAHTSFDLDIDTEQIKSRYIAKELMYNLFYTDPTYAVFDPKAIYYK